MINFLRRVLKPKYETLNKIEIDSAAIINNYNYLKSLQPQVEIFPVLKSNAYGHGLKEVCQILNRTDASMIAVDSYPEAQIAYRYFKGRVLILGEMPLRAYRYCKLRRTEFVIYNQETLRFVARYGRRAKVHLFINSGMNREGIKNLSEFIVANKGYLDRVVISGACSHMASAEEVSVLNQVQQNNFAAALEQLKAAGYSPRWVHLGNSAAVFILNNHLLTAFRPGLSIYGYSPFIDRPESESELRPALRVYSHIISIQSVGAGESVSYNEEYRATGPINIAVVPFGYFEGLDRRLSNRARFLVRGREKDFWTQVAGKVCMNLMCLDIGKQPAKVGDIVEIISPNGDDSNSVASIAKLLGTIPYEVLVKIQSSIRREII